MIAALVIVAFLGACAGIEYLLLILFIGKDNIAWQKENDSEEWARTKKALSAPIFLGAFTGGIVLFIVDQNGKSVSDFLWLSILLGLAVIVGITYLFVKTSKKRIEEKKNSMNKDN